MRMIDRYASWYTPTVLMIVGGVLFLSLGGQLANPWERAISMLVVACPCALILATPTAMVAALSSLARLGVLVKSVVDLESARNLTAMIFDKTGTLTTGELQVTRLTPEPNVEGAELLRIAAAAEQHSRHPVARAIAAVAGQARLSLPSTTAFEEVFGRGVCATIDGREALVGRAGWLTDQSHGGLASDTIPLIEAAQAHPEAEGLSVLFVVYGGRLLGWIGLEDNARPQAAAAVDRLRGLGIKRLIMVTGDRETVAKRVAGQLHTEYVADVLPQQKLDMVDRLKNSDHRVAVVGDGVNDAPALAAGDLSIAMKAAGSDVAIHSAKVVLMNNNLDRIPFLIDLSGKTTRVITENLLTGGAFIVIFMILSAANYVGPVTAAVLHTVSSLAVVFNSARLVRYGEQLGQSDEAGSSHEPIPGIHDAGSLQASMVAAV